MEPFKRIEQIIEGHREIVPPPNSNNENGSSFGYPNTEAAVNAGEYDLSRAVLQRIENNEF